MIPIEMLVEELKHTATYNICDDRLFSFVNRCLNQYKHKAVVQGAQDGLIEFEVVNND